MNPRIGIGVVTYNRREVALETVDAIRRMTGHAAVDVVVADDGSTDGTIEAMRRARVPVVTGINMGIAWNKNRALFLLGYLRGCAAVILLEDDTRPTMRHWEGVWIEAARKWGHVNWAKPDIRDRSESGAGTPRDPLMSPVTSAQCAAFSRDALAYAGYFDSRFKGYGHEHVEHSARMIRAGYGGSHVIVDGVGKVLFSLIDSDIKMVPTRSYFDEEQVTLNHQLALKAMAEQAYRPPWQNESEMMQFRMEMDRALASAPTGFDLSGGPNILG